MPARGAIHSVNVRPFLIRPEWLSEIGSCVLPLVQHSDYLDLVATVAEINQMRSDWVFHIVGAHIDFPAPLGSRRPPLDRHNYFAVVAVGLCK